MEQPETWVIVHDPRQWKGEKVALQLRHQSRMKNLRATTTFVVVCIYGWQGPGDPSFASCTGRVWWGWTSNQSSAAIQGGWSLHSAPLPPSVCWVGGTTSSTVLLKPNIRLYLVTWCISMTSHPEAARRHWCSPTMGRRIALGRRWCE